MAPLIPNLSIFPTEAHCPQCGEGVRVVALGPITSSYQETDGWKVTYSTRPARGQCGHVFQVQHSNLGDVDNSQRRAEIYSALKAAWPMKGE